MSLTNRQTQIIELLAQGNTAEQVAESMHRSAATVRRHILLACKRLDARNTAHLVAKALGHGWIKPVICLALVASLGLSFGDDLAIRRPIARVRIQRPSFTHLIA